MPLSPAEPGLLYNILSRYVYETEKYEDPDRKEKLFWSYPTTYYTNLKKRLRASPEQALASVLARACRRSTDDSYALLIDPGPSIVRIAGPEHFLPHAAALLAELWPILLKVKQTKRQSDDRAAQSRAIASTLLGHSLERLRMMTEEKMRDAGGKTKQTVWAAYREVVNRVGPVDPSDEYQKTAITAVFEHINGVLEGVSSAADGSQQVPATAVEHLLKLKEVHRRYESWHYLRWMFDEDEVLQGRVITMQHWYCDALDDIVCNVKALERAAEALEDDYFAGALKVETVPVVQSLGPDDVLRLEEEFKRVYQHLLSMADGCEEFLGTPASDGVGTQGTKLLERARQNWPVATAFTGEPVHPESVLFFYLIEQRVPAKSYIATTEDPCFGCRALTGWSQFNEGFRLDKISKSSHVFPWPSPRNIPDNVKLSMMKKVMSDMWGFLDDLKFQYYHPDVF
ncbi:hypothetical protein EIP91_011796 [Steccherinum ochraceum]|uniref:Uncharacterized protein n=1 Tax=Steccherinum ochraceum TaxID=92696 RepID=A0A4R0RL98_9APHY|nr:hypothetical protein EIP91_011796 [Steccherinum ochraceum]